MKKALIIVISLFLLTATSCGNSREISCKCECECECESCNVENNDIFSLDQEKDYFTSTTAESKKERTDKLYQEAKEMYLSGEWDGFPTTLASHEISFSPRSGVIQIDGCPVHSEKVDMPENFDYESSDSNLEYVPGYGMYMIKHGRLLKYQRGYLVCLEEDILDCNGNLYKSENSTEYNPSRYL